MLGLALKARQPLDGLVVIGTKIHTIWQRSKVRRFCIPEVTPSCLHLCTPLSRLAGRAQVLGRAGSH